ncbi:MAG: aldolase [Proteobacteria bacterium]|nr:aldolase [Pseudomonadota bacterium]MBI3499279.1 aldolase [Pseudomonadota bacterium]
MRNNPVKTKLARGEPVFGPMILDLYGPGLPQIMARAGADFIMYDMEAGCLDIAQLKTQVALTRGLPVVPMVNTPWHDYHLNARPLDCGVMGLMVPVVETVEQARALARIAHYPPKGVRGVAFGIAHDDYSDGASRAAMAAADRRTMVIVKIETTKGLGNVEEIMAVDGIDIGFVGHMDLSVSLGVPGDYKNRRFTQALERVVAACRSEGKQAACLVGDVETGAKRLAQGFRMILYATDVMLLTQGFRTGVDALRKLELKPNPGAAKKSRKR